MFQPAFVAIVRLQSGSVKNLYNMLMQITKNSVMFRNIYLFCNHPHKRFCEIDTDKCGIILLLLVFVLDCI